jgi:hypothetical protein
MLQRSHHVSWALISYCSFLRTKPSFSLSHIHRFNQQRTQSQSQSYITTHGQPANLSWCQTPIWERRPIFCRRRRGPIYYNYTARKLLFGLGYFKISQNQSQSEGQQKTAVIQSVLSMSKSLYDWRSVSQSVSLGIKHPYRTCDQILLPAGMLLSEIYGLVSMGRPLWREDGSAICSVITQWSESRRTRNHILLSHLRLPQPGGSVSRIYIPQAQGGPVIPLGIIQYSSAFLRTSIKL